MLEKNVKEELLEAKADLMMCTRVSRDAVNTYEDVQQFKVCWYHWLVDKELKTLEHNFLSGFNKHRALTDKMANKFRLAESKSVSDETAQTAIATLSVSAHMYVETGRLLSHYRTQSMIRFALAINIFVMSISVLSILFDHLF